MKLMKEVKITQAQFNELCNNGRLHFANHDVFAITWQTYFKHYAFSKDIRNEDGVEIIKLVIQDE